MDTLQQIQQDIKSLHERTGKAYSDTYIANYDCKPIIRAAIRQVFIQQKDLTKLLLRLSNVKPIGLYPSSANDESETPLPPPKPTLRELSKDRQKVRKQHWAPGEYVVLDSNGIIIKSTFDPLHTNMLIGQLGSTDGWEQYEEEEKPKPTGLTFLEATENGQKARRPKWKPGIWVKFFCGELIDQSSSPTTLREESYRANDWEVYKDKAPEPAKTITGYEAAKLMLEGRTVRRLSYPDRTIYALSKENLEANDWVEVEKGC